MRFSELADVLHRYGKKGKSKNLIIMPFYLEYETLLKHLEFLTRQTIHDFDVIIVLNVVSDETKIISFLEENKFDFDIVVVKRKEDTGSAGGFFTGQKYALENGYECMILADIDCMPMDKDLLISLIRNKDKGYVKPSLRLMNKGETIHIENESNIPFYNLISVEVAKEYGLYYMPIYYGGDDIEYAERIRHKVFSIKNYCEHPYGMAFSNLDRTVYYMIQSLVAVNKTGIFIKSFIYMCFSICAFLIFYPPYGKKAFYQMLRSLLSFSYGRPAYKRIKTGFASKIISLEKKEMSGFNHVAYSSAIYTEKSPRKLLWGMFNQSFRQKLLIESSKSSFLVTFASVFAKKALWRIDGDRYLLLSDNSNPFQHMFRLVAFAILLPTLTAFLSVTFIPQKILRQPKTERYGLD